MAEPVNLDAGSYGGTYKLLGGSVSLDFANLVSYRGTERQHDWLDTAGNLAAWCTATGLTGPARTPPEELLELREALASAYLAVAADRPPPADDIRWIGALASAERVRSDLRMASAGAPATWGIDKPTLAGRLALDAVELLTSEKAIRRIRSCDECKWVFLDTTRNRSRVWCDPADCGNRVRQRRHHRNTKSTPGDHASAKGGTP